jgi:hypothetical protein
MVGERVGVRAMSLASVCLLTIRAPRRELGEFAERARDDPERGDARAVVVVGEIPVRARKEAACTARRMARAIEGMILDVHGRRDWAGEENGWCGYAEGEKVVVQERESSLSQCDRRRLLIRAEFEFDRSHASLKHWTRDRSPAN